MRINNFTIPFLFLCTGFASAYVIFSPSADDVTPAPGYKETKPEMVKNTDRPRAFVNLFATPDDEIVDADRLTSLEADVSALKDQIRELTLALQENIKNRSESATKTSAKSVRPPYDEMRYPGSYSQRLFSLDKLIRGGIEQTLAEDIVRRKNAIELKKLQLQDRAKRENYLNTEQYYAELNDLTKDDINLRKELGDQRYDEYLFTSKQNNRIRINSVMLGSAAEQAGIQRGDVVISYDDKNLYTWQELKNATTEGELGEYVSISILRNGQLFSYSVPRGPLGMQLGATRIQP